MKLGIFGGTFDPPHNGHLILASEALDQLGLDRIIWILTPTPPHKLGNKILPLEDRLEMLEVAIAETPEFILSRVEIDRQGPHYAVDTIRLLLEKFPNDELFYLIGGDSLHDMPKWYKPGELLELCSGFGVMRRPGDKIDLTELEAKLSGISEKISFMEAPLLEIASRDIRLRVADSKHFRFYLPKAVYEMILDREYYQGY